MVVVVATVGATWTGRTLRRLEEPPAAAPAAPAQQKTQQMMETQMAMGMMTVTTIPAITTPTTIPVMLEPGKQRAEPHIKTKTPTTTPHNDHNTSQ